MEVQKVTAEQAAKEIGCDPLTVRMRMRRGEWDLGAVIKPGPGKKNWRCYIFRSKLDRFLGKIS